MNWILVTGAVVATALLAYLLAAMLMPERFE